MSRNSDKKASLHKALGLPSLTDRRLLIEDFNEVHRHSIEQALTAAVQTRPGGFNFYREHAVLVCSYRRDSGGNPSTCFTINDVIIRPDPDEPSYRSFRRSMVAPDEEMKREDPGYIGAMLTICQLFRVSFKFQ